MNLEQSGKYLDVHVTQATNVFTGRSGNPGNPYVELLMNNLVHRTSTVSNQANPTWGVTFRFPVVNEWKDMLYLTVWDEGSKDQMGSYCLNLGKIRQQVRLLNSNSQSLSLPLLLKSGRSIPVVADANGPHLLISLTPYGFSSENSRPNLKSLPHWPPTNILQPSLYPPCKPTPQSLSVKICRLEGLPISSYKPNTELCFEVTCGGIVYKTEPINVNGVNNSVDPVLTWNETFIFPITNTSNATISISLHGKSSTGAIEGPIRKRAFPLSSLWMDQTTTVTTNLHIRKDGQWKIDDTALTLTLTPMGFGQVNVKSLNRDPLTTIHKTEVSIETLHLLKEIENSESITRKNIMNEIEKSMNILHRQCSMDYFMALEMMELLDSESRARSQLFWEEGLLRSQLGHKEAERMYVISKKTPSDMMDYWFNTRRWNEQDEWEAYLELCRQRHHSAYRITMAKYWQSEKRIEVKIVEGQGLVSQTRDWVDPYLVLKLGPITKKTSLKRRDVQPIWNEDFTIPVLDQDDTLDFMLYNASGQSSSEDELIGMSRIVLDEWPKDKSRPAVVKLVNKDPITGQWYTTSSSLNVVFTARAFGKEIVEGKRIQVKVVSASKMPEEDGRDLYVSLAVGDKQSRTTNSKCLNSKSVWNEDIVLAVDDETKQTLDIEVRDGSAREVGRYRLQLDSLNRQQAQPLTLSLMKLDQQGENWVLSDGEITVVLTPVDWPRPKTTEDMEARITIQQAGDVLGYDKIGLGQLSVVAQMGVIQQKTNNVPSSNSPIWNQDLSFKVRNPFTQTLQISLMDDRQGRSTGGVTALGSQTIPLWSLPWEGREVVNLPLHDDTGRYTGIHILMTCGAKGFGRTRGQIAVARSFQTRETEMRSRLVNQEVDDRRAILQSLFRSLEAAQLSQGERERHIVFRTETSFREACEKVEASARRELEAMKDMEKERLVLLQWNINKRSATKIQALVRGFLARRRTKRMKLSRKLWNEQREAKEQVIYEEVRERQKLLKKFQLSKIEYKELENRYALQKVEEQERSLSNQRRLKVMRELDKYRAELMELQSDQQTTRFEIERDEEVGRRHIDLISRADYQTLTKQISKRRELEIEWEKLREELTEREEEERRRIQRQYQNMTEIISRNRQDRQEVLNHHRRGVEDIAREERRDRQTLYDIFEHKWEELMRQERYKLEALALNTRGELEMEEEMKRSHFMLSMHDQEHFLRQLFALQDSQNIYRRQLLDEQSKARRHVELMRSVHKEELNEKMKRLKDPPRPMCQCKPRGVLTQRLSRLAIEDENYVHEPNCPLYRPQNIYDSPTTSPIMHQPAPPSSSNKPSFRRPVPATDTYLTAGDPSMVTESLSPSQNNISFSPDNIRKQLFPHSPQPRVNADELEKSMEEAYRKRKEALEKERQQMQAAIKESDMAAFPVQRSQSSTRNKAPGSGGDLYGFWPPVLQQQQQELSELSQKYETYWRQSKH